MNLVKAMILMTTILTGQAAFANQMVKHQVHEVNPNAEVSKVETYYGDVLEVKKMQGFKETTRLSSIFQKREILMDDGNIYYPEEVEYIIESSSSSAIGSIQRAPHTPD